MAKSVREQYQDLIVEYLSSTDYWDAPYGILTGIEELPNGGKTRIITFGVAKYLDAVITIWSPKKITWEAQGSLTRYWGDGSTFESVEALINFIEKFAPPSYPRRKPPEPLENV